MDNWECLVRESIRDLVTRYNSNGDTGRFEYVLPLFSEDARMEIVALDGAVRVFEGIAEIESVFVEAKARWSAEADRRQVAGYVRHCVSTHQIDIVDATHAKGRSYYFVLMAHGLDHWGRYIDEYELQDRRWVFTARRVTHDGAVANSVN